MDNKINETILSELENDNESKSVPEFEKMIAGENRKEKNIGMAIVAYIVFFVPLFTDTKEDPFVKFHVKQGMLLFIGWIVISIISSVPLIAAVSWVFKLALLVLSLMGILNAADSKKKPLPFIGHLADKFNF